MSKLKQDSASVPISRDVTLIPAVGGARIMVNRTQLYAASAGEANWTSPNTIQFTDPAFESGEVLRYIASLVSNGEIGPEGDVFDDNKQVVPAVVKFLRRWDCPRFLAVICQRTAEAHAGAEIRDSQAFVIGALAEDVRLCQQAVAHRHEPLEVSHIPIEFWPHIKPEYLFALATIKAGKERIRCDELCDARTWRALVELGADGLRYFAESCEMGKAPFPLSPCVCKKEKKKSIVKKELGIKS
ncbi:hypothetical protein A1Q2_05926 [Trichosporon asahii var. asahii CBS 8904]|uniref:BTB domain-containing protein n=1 Tax=Trichosporon asahii var. asahii (strain CBS 8904) TaxID=1220162 RepID=K1VG53_TRIAC|nr:hypothetical protein A1Q2_05926 [Trichosporon asahii var. asahii CBS 8904]